MTRWFWVAGAVTGLTIVGTVIVSSMVPGQGWRSSVPEPTAVGSFEEQQLPTASVQIGDVHDAAGSAGNSPSLGTRRVSDNTESVPGESLASGESQEAAPSIARGAASSVVVGSSAESDGESLFEELSAIGETADPSAPRIGNAVAVPEPTADSGLIFGGRGATPTPRPTARPVQTPTPAPSATPTPTPLPLVRGQARGYAMLYLMQPGARQTAEREIQTLLDARVQRTYLGVLVDGTFGRDFDYLASVVRRINAAGRELVLSLYLTNGPTMRNRDPVSPEAGFNSMEPLLFRYMIRNDRGTRERFLSIANDVTSIFELNRSLNPRNRNIAIVQLEDNLDVESYVATRDLARSLYGTLVDFVRNPCPRCGVEGSDFLPAGDDLEFHQPEALHALGRGDGFTLDGESFRFAGETYGGLTVDEVKAFMSDAQEQGLDYFGLWRQQRQGIYEDGLRRPPEERVYEVPTDAQRLVEIELLRHGLEPIESAGN